MTATQVDSLQALIIDDQRSMRMIVKNLLRAVGVEHIAEAANGKEGLKYLRNRDMRFPDFIICDLHMDEMDGMHFCNVVRSDKNLRNQHVPILVLTGDADKLLHDVSRQVGAVSVLTKPVSADVLGSHIEKALGYAFANGG